MAEGRVGDGVARRGVRADRLWRHRRGERTALDPALAEVRTRRLLWLYLLWLYLLWLYSLWLYSLWLYLPWLYLLSHFSS